MNINFTLVIQAFNFLIAYLILRRMLFRPAVDAVFQERSHEAALRQAIVNEQAALAEREQQKNEQWQSCKLMLKKATPDVTAQDMYVYKNLALDVVAPVVDAAQVAYAQQELTTLIVEKVANDNA